LRWSAAADAEQYELHRGNPEGLPALLDGAVDSCTFGSYESTTTGPVLIESPPPQQLLWYLVTGRNAEGRGGAGMATAGPRVLDPTGSCAVAGGLVINEVDYDQPGTDSAEFVEIYNGLPHDQPLEGLVLILVNGGTSAEYGRFELSEAGNALPPGGYLVVASPAVLPTLPPGTLALAFDSTSNNVQNGAPDGIALFDTTTSILLDALSYEGSIVAAVFDGQAGSFNLVEGTPLEEQDSNADQGSLARSPSGTDTDDAQQDWRFVIVPTPGSANPLLP
jgi:hypothetical protein